MTRRKAKREPRWEPSSRAWLVLAVAALLVLSSDREVLADEYGPTVLRWIGGVAEDALAASNDAQGLGS